MAYENVKEVDCLDITREGSEAWDAAVRRYEERIDRVETRITAHLRDQLGTAKNANEMFRIFSRFNALFVRPHIRGAIREYQTQLIQRVKVIHMYILLFPIIHYLFHIIFIAFNCTYITHKLFVYILFSISYNITKQSSSRIGSFRKWLAEQKILI